MSSFWAQGPQQLEDAMLKSSPREKELERLIAQADGEEAKKALQDELEALRTYRLDDDSKALFLSAG